MGNHQHVPACAWQICWLFLKPFRCHLCVCFAETLADAGKPFDGNTNTYRIHADADGRSHPCSIFSAWTSTNPQPTLHQRPPSTHPLKHSEHKHWPGPRIGGELVEMWGNSVVSCSTSSDNATHSHQLFSINYGGFGIFGSTRFVHMDLLISTTTFELVFQVLLLLGWCRGCWGDPRDTTRAYRDDSEKVAGECLSWVRTVGY